MGPLIPLKM